MSRTSVAVCWLVFVLFQGMSYAAPPHGDAKALTLAARSLSVLTGGVSIQDVTLTGSATWGGTETGSATLKALGTAESRMDLASSTGTRSEVQGIQRGRSCGQWASPDGQSGGIASHNCMTDAAWFFPALSSLGGGQNRLLKYVGQEIRKGVTVEHLRSYVHDPNWLPAVAARLEARSSVDFYLDATTFVPVATSFNIHPDHDSDTDLLTEVEFSDYQQVNGVSLPMRIRKFRQGNLLLDFVVSNAAFNTGLGRADFAVNPAEAGR